MKLLYLDCFAGISSDMFLGPSPGRHGYGHTSGARPARRYLTRYE
jgi:hypothetical protein